MDSHALRVLEFDKVRARVAGLASFSGGRELGLALEPSPDFDEVLRRQQRLAEAIRLRSLRTPLNLGSATDVRAPAEKAGLGGVLDPNELLAIATTQSLVQQARSAITRLRSNLPLLAETADTIAEKPQLVNEITRAIDQRGEVVDSASPALGLIRRDIRTAHDRLHNRLQEFLASNSGRTAAQESIVTLRDGRYVVPIKAEFRGEVRGIVHDISSSGATIFVEPLVVVDLANRWRELQIEETREVERILRRLSGLAGDAAEAISHNVGVLAELDLLMASARFAEELSPHGLQSLPGADRDAQPAEWLRRDPMLVDLIDARHPLLTAPVPISARLGGADRVVLVTGPNTGGKTVALKTVGLMVLMSQAGLPVAAEQGSRLPVFQEVLADIGDEQSIEQSLSTFSGHLRNIVGILERAGPRSLVLLDELAAGTDPAEGAALARALLLDLMGRGAVVLATTHHGELKLFAHSTPGVKNAAVEFDPVTLAPTYRLTIGLPGRSNALAIASRLGLPESILETARASLAPEQQAIDSLLDDLREERQAAAESRRAEEQARRQAEEARVRVEAKLAALDDEKADRLDQAAQALESELALAREALARAQRLAQRQPAMVSPAEILEVREALGEAAETAKKIRRRSRRRRHGGGITPEQIKPGFQVWLQGVPTPAEALTAPDRRGEIDVSLGALRARVPVTQVIRVERPSATPIYERTTIPPPPPNFVEQIEVRGQTLDEALPKVERFLDDGFRAGAPRLRVIHGKGTGKMKNAVRQMLDRHPYVRGYQFAERSEGGEGVTVVEMAVT